MYGNNIFIVAFIVAFLELCPMTESHWKLIGPLCASQITLVNHACSFLPYTLTPPPSPSSLVSSPPSLVSSVISPPSLVSAPSLPRPEGRHSPSPSPRHRHRHATHRRHHRHHESNPEEEICCRWLREVDDECVCDLLAQLPAFLSRPVHQYSVIVGDTCYESFQCGSRIKI